MNWLLCCLKVVDLTFKFYSKFGVCVRLAVCREDEANQVSIETKGDIIPGLLPDILDERPSEKQNDD